jgi:hypothetical protein
MSNTVNLMKILWCLFFLREALCFCAGGELHASLVTCNVMLLATASHVFKQGTVNEGEDKRCRSFYVSNNSLNDERLY